MTPVPPLSAATRDAVQEVIATRRDIRSDFTMDPIEQEALTRILLAAHRAPSVGLSQPWDFLLLREENLRREVAALAAAQRDAYAASLPTGRARSFEGLKVEAIMATPLNIVVTCDPTRGGPYTLGRHADPRMAPFSVATAVQNLWLAARVEGIGVGWVSFFDPEALRQTLALPEHLEVVAYLCIGHVREFP
ncbi:MAG: 5,6-dimethylbenzimidazole synthase, partial [Micrococcales bacterium]|nr:5,6-dimethylbenzimidazole synthase [Micrococcales bacterium]